MFLDILLTSIALLLVFEGIMPFATPMLWRKTMMTLATQTDRTIRIMGLVSLVSGAVLMYLVHFGVL